MAKSLAALKRERDKVSYALQCKLDVLYDQMRAIGAMEPGASAKRMLRTAQIVAKLYPARKRTQDAYYKRWKTLQ
jgi:hypothetical protein